MIRASILVTIIIIGGFLLEPALAGQAFVLTGRYDLKNGAQQGTLYVKELPGKKISFSIQSEWIGDAKMGNVNVGEADGTVPVAGNVAVYKGTGFKLTFTFSPATCKVVLSGEPSTYGGMNVDPNGTYRKTSKSAPTKEQLNPES